jgi:hemolysin III
MLEVTNKHQKAYSTGEEIANGVTHGIGVLLSIAGLVILIVTSVSHGTAWHIVSFSIFGSALIILYLFSTLYHSLPNPFVKKVFKRLDHAAIFILIAGTYTPFMLTNLRGVWGWSLFGVIWTLAILGVVLKSVWIHKFKKTSVAVYVMMGWLCLIAFRELIKHVPPLSLVLLAVGGIFYTMGVIFYGWKKLPFNHAVWHVFVLGGSAFHFFSVLNSIC